MHYRFPTLSLDCSALAVQLLSHSLSIQEFEKQIGHNGSVSQVLMIFTLGSCCSCKIQTEAMRTSLVPEFSLEGSGSFVSTTNCTGGTSPVPHSQVDNCFINK